MLRILRVSGDSLYPEVVAGDFLLIASYPGWRNRLRSGDIVTFHQPGYGFLVKRIASIDEINKTAVMAGNIPESIDSRHFGDVPITQIQGKVVWRITRRAVPG